MSTSCKVRERKNIFQINHNEFLSDKRFCYQKGTWKLYRKNIFLVCIEVLGDGFNYCHLHRHKIVMEIAADILVSVFCLFFFKDPAKFDLFTVCYQKLIIVNKVPLGFYKKLKKKMSLGHIYKQVKDWISVICLLMLFTVV